MEKDQDNGIDNLFKQGLKDPEGQNAYREDNWDALDQMLDKDKKRGLVFWLPILSGVAAVLLLVFGLWWYKAQVEVVKSKTKPPVIVKLNAPQPKTGIAKTQLRVIDSGNNTTSPRGITNISQVASLTQVKPSGKFHTIVTKQTAFVEASVQKDSKENTGKVDVIKSDINKTAIDKDALASNDNTKITTANNDNTIAAVTNADNQTIVDTSIKSVAKFGIKQVKKASSFRPAFAVSVIASTELNTVGSFGQNKAGTNFGLLFSATLIPKFTITTGASYATKPYRTNFDNYYTTYKFTSNPTSIQADCRVLDIPLNIDYQVYNKHRNKFSVGTGVSSYIMLHESYDYTYTDPTSKPATYSVLNPSKYLFSILNLQATYQRQINSKISLSLQPYYKLPLADIGASKVRLQTMGIAVGVNMNLGKLAK